MHFLILNWVNIELNRVLRLKITQNNFFRKDVISMNRMRIIE